MKSNDKFLLLANRYNNNNEMHVLVVGSDLYLRVSIGSQIFNFRDDTFILFDGNIFKIYKLKDNVDVETKIQIKKTINQNQ